MPFFIKELSMAHDVIYMFLDSTHAAETGNITLEMIGNKYPIRTIKDVRKTIKSLENSTGLKGSDLVTLAEQCLQKAVQNFRDADLENKWHAADLLGQSELSMWATLALTQAGYLDELYADKGNVLGVCLHLYADGCQPHALISFTDTVDSIKQLLDFMVDNTPEFINKKFVYADWPNARKIAA
jgi:hypothetical protein